MRETQLKPGQVGLKIIRSRLHCPSLTNGLSLYDNGIMKNANFKKLVSSSLKEVLFKFERGYMAVQK